MFYRLTKGAPDTFASLTCACPVPSGPGRGGTGAGSAAWWDRRVYHSKGIDFPPDLSYTATQIWRFCVCFLHNKRKIRNENELPLHNRFSMFSFDFVYHHIL